MTNRRLDGPSLDLMFRHARSYNGYSSEPFGFAEVQDIYDLMKMGPTSVNMSPARFVWCLSDEAKQRLAPITSETNQKKVLNAPAAVIVGTEMRFYDALPRLFPHTDARSWFVGDEQLIETSAFRNSSLQGAYLIMAARALGFDVGPLSGFDNMAVDAEFFKGTSFRSNFICTMGVGDPASIFERLPRLAFDEANSIL